MTEVAPEKTEEVKKTTRKRIRISAMIYFFMVAVFAVAGFFMWAFSRDSAMESLFERREPSSYVNEAVIDSYGQQIKVNDEKIKNLEASIEKIGSSVVPAPDAESAAPLKIDVVSLTAALAALQSQLSTALKSAGKSDDDNKALIGAVVSYFRLRIAADAGRDFSKELDALRGSALKDGDIAAQIAVLEKHSGGAAMPQALRAEFAKLSFKASSSARIAAAKDWKERLMAELASLVTIRSGDEVADSEPFLAIDADLEKGRFDDALDKANKLSDAAKKELGGWIAKLEAKAKTEAALNAIADRITVKTQADETETTEDSNAQ